ncbi:UPF0175 family protein [Tunicatimonas pelagia]|uniref:UPF0175 family protein n=1 Tax=Tunicatimonas pelagia TaxID=931531 RepID=UPI002664FF04|nr:UPF0175 family protein [Tunicatimonas pelagia]WKN40809.1 UPF0175 family protein [Tunicatimonas pelagia]
MKNITIPLTIPQDILITLNQKEEELREQFQITIAMMLFQQEKLTIGKAVQLSGVDCYEFEKALAKNNVPVVDTSIEEVFADATKLKNS